MTYLWALRKRKSPGLGPQTAAVVPTIWALGLTNSQPTSGTPHEFALDMT